MNIVAILGPWARFLAARSALSPEPFDLPIGKCVRAGAPRGGPGDRVYLAAFGLVRAYGVLLRRVLMVDGWHLILDGRPGLHVPIVLEHAPIKTGWFDGWREPWWDAKQEREWPQGFAWQRMGVPPDALAELDASPVPILGSVAPPPPAKPATAILCSRGPKGARCETIALGPDGPPARSTRAANMPDPMEAPSAPSPPAPRPKRPGGAPSAAPPKQAPAAPQLGLFGAGATPRRPS